MKFELRCDNEDGSECIRKFEQDCWQEVLEEMFLFLKGCGYLFDVGDRLTIVNNEGDEK